MSNAECFAARQRRSALPSSLAPRGLSRAAAAEYIGVSPSTFEKMVADGQMPGPKKFRGRLVWDRVRLDESFSAFDDEGTNPWD